MNPEWPSHQVTELQKRKVLLVEDGNHGEYRPRRHEFGQGSCCFIRAANMDSGRVGFDGADRISDVAVQRIRKGIGKGGDVIFSHKGTVGKLALTEEGAPPFVCSPQTTFWRSLDESKLDRRFLYYQMASRSFQSQWHSRKGETDMADYVSLTAQRSFTLQIPRIEIQRAIADVLGALDDKIELTRKTNRTLEATAQAIFRSWFVDFDPVVARVNGLRPFGMTDDLTTLFPKHFVESALGPIPEGWTPSSIADIAEYVNGRNFTKGANGKGKMVIRIAELNSGPSGSTKYHDQTTTSKHTAFPDDILFAWSGSLDVYRWHRDEALINQHIFKVICDRYPPWFVFFALKEAMPFFQGIASDKATTMGHIKRGHLGEALLAAPPDELIDATTAVVGPLYSLIHKYERQSQTLASIRNTLLPRLLSGEIQLVEAEETAEATV